MVLGWLASCLLPGKWNITHRCLTSQAPDIRLTKDEDVSATLIHAAAGTGPGFDLFHPLIATKVLLELVWPPKQ